MPKVKINADGVGYSLPNPVDGQPPILAAAYRGEVVEMSVAEVERLRKVRVRVFYTDPVTGAADGAYREEPSVVDASEAETADADAIEQARQRVKDLEDQLAQARADLPPSVAVGRSAVPLLPAQGAARELPPLDVPLLATDDEPPTEAKAPARKAAAPKAATPPPPPAPPAPTE